MAFYGVIRLYKVKAGGRVHYPAVLTTLFKCNYPKIVTHSDLNDS